MSETGLLLVYGVSTLKFLELIKNLTQFEGSLKCKFKVIHTHAYICIFSNLSIQRTIYGLSTL